MVALLLSAELNLLMDSYWDRGQTLSSVLDLPMNPSGGNEQVQTKGHTDVDE